MNEQMRRAKRLIDEATLLLRGELKHTTLHEYCGGERESHNVATIKYPIQEFPEHIQFIEKDSSKFVFGGMEVHSTNVLRIISELESAFMMLKYLGFEEDMITLQEIKSRYYKMYFKLAKQEKSMLD